MGMYIEMKNPSLQKKGESKGMPKKGDGIHQPERGMAGGEGCDWAG